MLYKVTYFGNAVNYGSEQFFMCPMFVTECFHNKCLNCQPCVQFIFSPGCESDMILSVMTLLLARAQMIGRLLLEQRTKQALEYEKKNRQYTNEEMFQDDQMMYLLAPHSLALQTDTTKFK